MRPGRGSLTGQFLIFFTANNPPNTHLLLPGIYIAPLQETYSEVLSVQLRPKRNKCLTKLAEGIHVVLRQQTQRKREFCLYSNFYLNFTCVRLFLDRLLQFLA